MSYEHQSTGTIQGVNAELEKIQESLKTKLSRQEADERTMLADLDMNSNRILNLPAPIYDTEPVRVKDLVFDLNMNVDPNAFTLYRSPIAPPVVNGHAWFDKDSSFYIGDSDTWNLVASGSDTSAGIVYSPTYPAQVQEGVTFFNADRFEQAYSYNDGDSLQYLAIPFAGVYGTGSGGGSGSGSSTLQTASLNGFSLVADNSTNDEHRVKSIVPGLGMKATTIGTELTLIADVDNADTLGSSLVVTTDGTVAPKKKIKRLKQGLGVSFTEDTDSITIASTGGGVGGGLVYTNTYPTDLVEGTTYLNHERMEIASTYNDGDSLQIIAQPLTGTVPAGSSVGGGTANVFNAGSTADGAGIVLPSVDSNIPLRRLKAGTSATTTITESGNSILIDALDVVNAGSTGLGLIKTKTTTQVPVKRLVAGTNVTLTDAADTITISSTGGGSGSLNDPLVRINALAPENNNVMVWTASGVSQFLTTAATRAMMGLGTVANTIPMFTGSSTATLASLTPYAVGLIASTGAPSALTALKITSGNTANGGWLRIGTGDTSGVQICWHTIICAGTTGTSGSGFVGAQTVWTYPQAFNGTPSVSSSLQDGISAWITNGESGNSSTVARFRQMSFVNGTGNAAVGVMAIGFY